MSRKVVLVTGGSRGLGNGLIENLLKQDCYVASFSRTKPEVKFETDSSEKLPRFLGKAIDLRDFEGIKDFLSEIVQTYGRIDALINNAAINFIGLFALTNKDKIDEIFNVNVTSVIKLTQMTIPIMMKKNGGVIINISSIMAKGGYRGSVVYGASKAAIDGFTSGLAREFGERNIRVNSIVPGYIETDMTKEVTNFNREKILNRTPLKRLGRTEDIYGLVDFLISDSSKHITGQHFIVDGGLTC